MREHGFFEMKILDQTLVIKCIGCWNFETILHIEKEYKELASTINHKPWACLVDLIEWELTSPETLEHISVINKWGNLNNQRYEVVVCNLAIQKAVFKDSHKVLTNVETTFRHNLEDAYKWLSSKGVMKI